MAQQRLKLELPKDLTPKQRDDIGWRVIEYIQRRATDHNKGFNPDTGREFKLPKYTKDYAQKKGVSTSDVDLVLSADMFNEMKVLSKKLGEVVVGFDAGSEANAKAEGNQLGTYGQKSPIPGKARPFLGLPKGQLERIIKEVYGS